MTPKRPFVETVTERFAGQVISSTVRPVTDADIRSAARLHAAGKCPHNLVVDEPGWPYDFRSCYTCGRGLGTI